MKMKGRNLTLRQIICAITGAVSFVLFLFLTWFGGHIANGLLDQQTAKRWSQEKDAAQISCFFSQGTEVTRETVLRFESELTKALQEESITSDSANPGARLWADAYSASGKITLQNGKKSVTAKAIGVAGDFFLFHPLKLLYGSLFSGSDIMQDYVVIDEDMAWQLFGSNDVAGMQVTINNVPHIVSGVIERESGHMNDAAGNDVTCVYVSYSSLEEYGENYGINCYEIVMPNPITGYALAMVKEKIGFEDNEVSCIENSSRYSMLSLGGVLLSFTSRSMGEKAIIYPYWENVARGWEDVLARLLLLRVILLLIPCVMLIILVVKLWKKRTWNWRDALEMLKKSGVLLGKGMVRLGKGAKNYKKKIEKEADLEELDL